MCARGRENYKSRILLYEDEIAEGIDIEMAATEEGGGGGASRKLKRGQIEINSRVTKPRLKY